MPTLRDATTPSRTRQTALRQAYAANMAQGLAPYAGVHLRTYGEVQWILHEHQWSGDILLPEGFARANLSGAIFEEAHLGDITLYEADLHDARLFLADVSGAEWRNANLSGAYLSSANLHAANLSGANLTDANLSGADCSEANLSSANLSGAHLDLTRLDGADLRYATMSPTTLFVNTQLTPTTKLRNVQWRGADVSRIDWQQVTRLGDEALLSHSEVRSVRTIQYREMARTYRMLVLLLKSQGIDLAASRFRLYEHRWERRAQQAEGNIGGWFFSWLLDVVAGYGEQPGKTFAAYVVVIVGFAGLYSSVTQSGKTHLSKLTWDEALVLSLTSFHGRGFFPGALSLGDWVVRLGALEAVIGLFIELILIATFSRRFLGS